MVERGIQGANAADELDELDLLEELNDLEELVDETTQSKVVARPSAPVTRSSVPPPARTSAPPPLPPEARRPSMPPGSLPPPRSGIFAIDSETAAALDAAAGVDTDLRARALQVDRLRLNVRLRDDRIRELERALQAQSQREHDLERRLEEQRVHADELQTPREGAAQRESAEPELQALRARANELELQLSALQTQLDARASELQAQRARADELQRQLDERAAQKSGDDLKRIAGIGPSFERALAKMGITRFEQIAAWSPTDVLELAGALNISPRRIERDGWIERARALHGAAEPQPVAPPPPSTSNEPGALGG